MWVNAMKNFRRVGSAVSLVLCLGFPDVTWAAEPLPKLNLNVKETTVSGLSSGAFMTVQLQTAFSSNIAGVGVVAGGPYGCAVVQSWWNRFVYYRALKAVGVCMDNTPGPPEPAQSLNVIQGHEERIDPPGNIAADRVYLFHGTADKTVRGPTMQALAEVYAALNVPEENIRFVKDINAGHGFLTASEATNACPAEKDAAKQDLSCGVVECAVTAPDFLNSCTAPEDAAEKIGQAKDILSWLYGPLAPEAGPVKDNFKTFDQSLYTGNALGIGEVGYAYIPSACADGETCRLHIALHGCQQTSGQIGKKYALLTQYNRWAESNRIVVLYPQAAVIPGSIFNWFGLNGGNPKGCWDWWGYSGQDFLTKDAPQIAAIGRMAAALGAPIADPAPEN
jgi:poly(3-hydroxybutyrate) depolymerase